MTTKDIYSQSEHHMKRSIETLKENLMKIRTGRAHTGLLEHITVDYYGCPTPISQVAQLGLADARTITVQPWEKKMVAVVEKAIRNSDLGLNPATSGEVIRVPMPPLTEERRSFVPKAKKLRLPSAICAVTPTTRLPRSLRKKKFPKTTNAVPILKFRSSPISTSVKSTS